MTSLSSAQVNADPNSAGPSFLIGIDLEGHWLALESHGRGGGLFRTREAALRYAAMETDRRKGAVQVVSERLQLPL